MASTLWMASGQSVYISTGGYYTVSAINSTTSATLTNTGASGNASPGAVIASGSAVTASGASGLAGAGSIVTADTSAMTGGNGTFACLLEGLNAVPTNNLEPRSCIGAGCLQTSGQILGAGPVPNAQVTYDGGKPRRGDVLYYAAASDDLSHDADGPAWVQARAKPRGQGRLTKTRPRSVSLIQNYSGFSGEAPQIPVVAGICTDNTSYDSAGTVGVLLLAGARPDVNLPADQFFQSPQLEGFTANDYYRTAANLAGAEFHDGKTKAINFSCDTTSAFAGSGWLWGSLDGVSGSGNGWFVACFPNIFVFIRLVSGNIAVLDTGFAPSAGENCLAFTVRGTTLYASLNGAPEVSITVSSPIVDPTTAGTAGLGHTVGYATTGGPSPWLKVQSLMHANRSFTPKETVSLSSRATDPRPFNRFVWPEWVTADPDVAWTWSPSTALQLSPAIAPYNWSWSVVGALTISYRTDVVIYDLAAYYLDTEPVYYDSLGIPRASAMALLEYTADAEHAMLRIGIRNINVQDWDNDTIGVRVAGATVPSVPRTGLPPPTGEIFWTALRCWLTSSPGAKTMQLIAATGQYEQILGTRGLAAVGGTVCALSVGIGQTFGTSTCSKRIVFIGDDPTSGENTGQASEDVGYSSYTRHGLITKIRETYGGRVTSLSATGRSVSNIWNTYGSMVPFAKRAVAATNEGAPSERWIFIGLGWRDYVGSNSIARCTVAQYQARLLALVDAIHAEDAAVVIFLLYPPQRLFDATVNSNGETLAQFLTAIDAVRAARSSFVRPVVNTRTPNVITFTSDGSPNSVCDPAGLIAMRDNIKLATGYT